MTLIIRPVKPDDLPEDIRSRTVRGFAGEMDGKLVGVMGVMHDRNAPQAFSTILDDTLRKHPREIVRAIRLFEDMLRQHYDFVVAAASPTEEGTYRTLERAGFRPYTKPTDDHRGLWIWTR